MTGLMFRDMKRHSDCRDESSNGLVGNQPAGILMAGSFRESSQGNNMSEMDQQPHDILAYDTCV